MRTRTGENQRRSMKMGWLICNNTSGSTATPKGVMVSHLNVAAHSDYIHYGFAHYAREHRSHLVAALS
jgi:long-subunit acyl-CoA synthetase (AMP-forming)